MLRYISIIAFAVICSAQSYPPAGGGGGSGLPVATAAGQVPISTGAGTTYVATSSAAQFTKTFTAQTLAVTITAATHGQGSKPNIAGCVDTTTTPPTLTACTPSPTIAANGDVTYGPFSPAFTGYSNITGAGYGAVGATGPTGPAGTNSGTIYGGKVVIGTTTSPTTFPGGSVATFTTTNVAVTSMPQGYTTLKIRITGAESVANDQPAMTFNASSASQYRWSYGQWIPTVTPFYGDVGLLGFFSAGVLGGTTCLSTSETTIAGYSISGFSKPFQSKQDSCVGGLSNTYDTVQVVFGEWQNTAAITGFTLAFGHPLANGSFVYFWFEA